MFEEQLVAIICVTNTDPDILINVGVQTFGLVLVRVQTNEQCYYS